MLRRSVARRRKLHAVAAKSRDAAFRIIRQRSRVNFSGA